MNDATESGASEVERLAQDFLERRRRGERPGIEEYAAAHPDLAAEIRDFFSTLIIVEELGNSLTGAESAASDSAVAPPAATGLQQVGEYRILREIGRGGMGVVYEAEQVSLGRRVALKVLPFHSLLDQKRLERFRQEARAAARLSHPNIVPVYGVGEHLGMHYYAMQFIPGQGLNRVIEEVRRIRARGEPEGDVASLSSSTSLSPGNDSGGTRGSRDRYFRNMARLARDAALALDYAHGEGILHRDVKPSNLLLDPSGRVWLTDFGLAKAEGNDELTKSGDFVGTLLYMAPERFKGWCDPRSDVYCLGITLHELLTLKPAFSERDRAQLLRKVAVEDPPPPRRIDRTIPRDLETIVLKATAKEPAQRYGSARAMAQDLDRFLNGLPVEARRSHVLARLWSWCTRNPLPAALAAAVFILLIVVAVSSAFHMVRLADKHAEGQSKLRAAHLAGASALRASVRPGRRFEALEVLAQAAAINPGPDLVDEALACLALVDLRMLRTWNKKKDEIFVLSPDGSLLARGMLGGEIVFRTVSDDKEIFRLPGPDFPVDHTGLKFSQDGRHLAVRHHRFQDRRMEWHVWDLRRRVACVKVTDAHDTGCCDFSPNGRWVALGTRDRTLRLVDLSTGDIMEELGQGLDVKLVAVHPGGRLLALSSGRTRKVHVFDREGSRVIRTLGGLENIGFNQLAWHPEGRTLAAANDDHIVYVWDAETAERSRILQGHSAEVVGTTFIPGGSLLASLGWDPGVMFWDLGSNRPILSLHNRTSFEFLTDRRSGWTTNYHRAELWEIIASPPAFTLFGHERMVGEGMNAKHPHAIALAPEGRLAATAGDDGVRLWDLASRTEVGQLERGKVISVMFDPAGKNLYTSGVRGLYRWPLRSSGEGGTRIAVGPARRLTQMVGWRRASLGDGGRKMLAVHEHGHAHLFAPEEPDQWIEFSGPPPDWFVALSPDGAWAAASSFQGEDAWLWNTRDAKPGSAPPVVRKFPGRRARVKFDPSGTHLAICAPEDCTLWRLSDGQVAWRLERDSNMTFSGPIAFDPGGRTMAVTYNDSRIWLLEVATGKKLCELKGSETVPVTDLALGGGRVVASALERQIHVWDMNKLGREIAALGLSWTFPVSSSALDDLSPLWVTIVEASSDLLEEEGRDLSPRQLFRPTQGIAFRPWLSSYAEIDQALATPTFLIPEGEAWRYFPGRAEPSPGVEWTSVEHDEGGWSEGRSPLSGWNLPGATEAAVLRDQLGSYTTLYARRAFTVDDPAAFSRVILAIEAEDGLVAHLNGEEIGRVNAGARGERLSFRALAPRRDRTRVTEVFEIAPGLLRSGKNVLACQVLTYGLESNIHFLPVLAAVLVPDAGRDPGRTENMLTGQDGRAEASLLAYREGRVLQRAARWPQALEQFERVSALDPGAAEPLLRRLACHRALGELQGAEALAREAIEGGEILDEDRLWRAWHHAALVDMRRSPAEALASLPGGPVGSPAGPAASYRRLLEDLVETGAIRINCGGAALESADGNRWLADGFFLGGSSHNHGKPQEGSAHPAEGGDRALHDTERWLTGTEPFRNGYSIPLPPGAYRISLHFLERTHHAPGRRSFDILLEGKVVLEGHDPFRVGFAVPDIRSFEITVEDGALDLDFVAHRDHPRLAAIEVEARRK